MSILTGDTFVRDNNTLNMGDAWSLDEPSSAEWTIEGSQAKCVTPPLPSDGTAAVYLDLGVPTRGYSVYLTMGSTIPNTGWVGPISFATYNVGLSSLDSCYALLFDLEDRTVKISLFSSFPTETVLNLGTYSTAIKRGTVLKLTTLVQDDGSVKLTGYIDRVKVIETVDPASAPPLSILDAGILVFEPSGAETVLFDGFSIEAPGAERPKKPRITHLAEPSVDSYQVVAFASAFKPSFVSRDHQTLHKQSRWQLWAEVDFIDTLIQDTGWVDNMLTTAFFNDVDPENWLNNLNITFSIRVKYRDEWGHDTAWSEFTEYSIGANGANVVSAPHSDVAPFPIDPTTTYGFEEALVNLCSVRIAEDGTESRVPISEKTLRTFAVFFQNMHRDEIEVFWNHFQQAKGKFGVFVFCHPVTGATYTVKYGDDSFDRTEFEHLINTSGGLTLRELA